MTTKFRWTAYESIQTYLSTALNSLANNGNKLGAEIDNRNNRHFYMDIEVLLAQVDLSAQTNPSIDIYLLPSLDDTNYADGADATDPSVQHLAKSVGVLESDAAHREVSRGIVIPPAKFKLLVENKTGAALAASGNTVKYRTYHEEVVAA